MYIQTLLEIGTIVHLKKPDIFTHFLTWEIGSENIDIFQVYRDITIVSISS